MFGGVGNKLRKDCTFLQHILFRRVGEVLLEATKVFFCTLTMDWKPCTSQDSSFVLCTSNTFIQATVFQNSFKAMNGFSANDFWCKIPRTWPNVEAMYTFSVQQPVPENQLVDTGYPLSEMRFSNSTCWYSLGNTFAKALEQNLEGLPLHRTEFNATHDFFSIQ